MAKRKIDPNAKFRRKYYQILIQIGDKDARRKAVETALAMSFGRRSSLIIDLNWAMQQHVRDQGYKDERGVEASAREVLTQIEKEESELAEE